MIELLKKGIAIHHAGVMPILREMIELLFEKKYIKLLFATETFAVGINMPTKTVIFTSLTKFSGNEMRYLLPHEYTQMAGRAGRRGIDTVGHVIHCNNLFAINSFPNDYRNMLTGPPKMLKSQFKISYNLILNILNNNNTIESGEEILINFMEKSFMHTDIVKEINSYDSCQKKLEEELNIISSKMNSKEVCKTEISVLKEYYNNINKMNMISIKQKKKIQKEVEIIKNNNFNITKDIILYEEFEKKK